VSTAGREHLKQYVYYSNKSMTSTIYYFVDNLQLDSQKGLETQNPAEAGPYVDILF